MDQVRPDFVYDEVARIFVTRVLVAILSALHDRGVVNEAQIRAHDPKSDDLLFQIAFATLTQFEEMSGFDFKDERFFAHGLLSRSLSDPAEFFAQVRRTDLHGNIDDETLGAAFAQVAARL